jgi:hypothetical protein
MIFLDGSEDLAAPIVGPGLLVAARAEGVAQQYLLGYSDARTTDLDNRTE